jgi:hypothetical protein
VQFPNLVDQMMLLMLLLQLRNSPLRNTLHSQISSHSSISHFFVGNVVPKGIASLIRVVNGSNVIVGYFYLQQRKRVVPLQRLLQK